MKKDSYFFSAKLMQKKDDGGHVQSGFTSGVFSSGVDADVRGIYSDLIEWVSKKYNVSDEMVHVIQFNKV